MNKELICIIKHCIKCQRLLTLNCFPNHKPSKDGTLNVCKQCKNIRKHELYIQKRASLGKDDLDKIIKNGYKKVSIFAKERFKDKTQHPRYKGNVIICQYCKKEFESMPSRKQAFCSKECYSNHLHTSKKVKIKICENCHNEFNAKRNDTKCCSARCSYELTSIKRANKCKNIRKNNIPLYDTLASQIEKYEQIRRDINNPDILNVKCAYCGIWFIPKRKQVYTRISCINGEQDGSGMFYCNNNCKNACPIFNQKKYTKNYKPMTSREIEPLIRQMAMERDEYKCQKCFKTINEIELHAHHILSYNQNKILANDIDNVIILCKDCHREIHRKEGCKYHELKCK